jgi:carboxylesterase type B
MEWHRALPITMMFRETALSFRNVSNSIFSFYFEDENTNRKDRRHLGQKFHKFEELTQMYSDRYFFIPAHKTGFIHGSNNNAPCYLYWFDYKGNQSATQMSGYNDTVVGKLDYEFNLKRRIILILKLKGAAHTDQIQYLFNSPYFKEPEDEEDIKFGRKFLSGIVRFIQTG